MREREGVIAGSWPQTRLELQSGSGEVARNTMVHNHVLVRDGSYLQI